MGPGLVAVEYQSGIRLYAIDKQGEQALKSLDPEAPSNARCLEKFDNWNYFIFKPLEAIEVMVRK